MDFIERIARYVVKHSKDYGILVNSPIIAQAILESARGTSELAVKAKNFFGLKYTQGRCPTCCDVYYKIGSEQNRDGVYFVSAMKWCRFDSVEDCVLGYFDFLKNGYGRYDNLIGVTDPETYLKLIKEDGYATSLKYVENLMKVIVAYDLTKYDTERNEENNMDRKTAINLHAGHNPDGMVACGAVGYIKESVENRLVKDEVLRQLELLDNIVYDCTCNNGTSISNILHKIVGKCNAHEVALDVSIHFNAFKKEMIGDGITKGVEVLVYEKGGVAEEYAQRIAKEIASLGFNNRGVKERKDLFFLANTKAQAILIECCFVDDIDDVALYDYRKMAGAIVKGITGNTVEDIITNNDSNVVDDTNDNETKPLYRVQVGAYSIKENANAQLQKLKDAGFKAFITQA